MTSSTSTQFDDPESTAWLSLLRAPGLGSAAIRAAIEQYGTASVAVAEILQSKNIPDSVTQYLKKPDQALLQQDLKWLKQPQHYLLGWNNPDYPDLLRRIPAAPAALFVEGNCDVLWSPQLAVVGSRNATMSGKTTARAFAKAIAETGIVITSGLAEGIDASAHEAALDSAHSTIAVVGTGTDVIYPRKHKALAERIRNFGAIVSEFPPGVPARAEHFPRRNRIIAGLSLGTLVIEASLQSGSLITARLAAEQGREVFAIPGSIHSPLARGCHQLIRNGAKLIETTDEIITELSSLAGSLGESLRRRLHVDEHEISKRQILDRRDQDPDYARLLLALGHEPASVDTLADRSGLTVAAVSSMLLILELEGVIAAEAGGSYTKIVGQ